MPLTKRGQEVLADFQDRYGPEQGKRFFYATLNKRPELKGKLKMKEEAERIVEALLAETEEEIEETTTSGDIATVPKPFVPKKDLPDEEETRETGIDYTPKN